MFLHATWSTSEKNSSQSKRIQTVYGGATVELRVECGRGDLALLFRVTQAGRYMDHRRYGAFGMLLTLCEELPRCEGKQVILKLTSASELWQNRGVQGIFQRAGFICTVKNGTLELRSDQSPLAAIEKAAVVSFAVDAFSQSIAKNVLSQRAMKILGRHQFMDGEVLELLGERGAWKLRKLLQSDSPKQENKQREAAIISALARVKTKALVQFHSGRFLGKASKLLHLEDRIAVEPSLKRSVEPVTGYRRLHGSVIEPPKGLPPTATALLVGALPPLNDSRRARAAEVLFKEVGFDWVLCIERNRDLCVWAEEVSAKYGYKCATWEIGTEYAAMFRRVAGSVPRTTVTSRVSLQIEPRVGPGVILQPDEWASTVEAASCLTVDPKWLIYLPPRANNLQSESLEEDLESPQKVFEYYRGEGITKVVLMGKPLGARGVVVVCRDETSVHFRGGGSLYRRTGRPFLNDDQAILGSLRRVLSEAEFWERFQTDWVCLECEVLPWVLKGSTAFGNVHTPLLEAGEAMYSQAQTVLRERFGKLPEAVSLGQERFRRYRTLYERCASERDLDMFLAPVHLIATEGRSYFNQTNLWHMQTLNALVRKAGAPFVETPYKAVALDDERSVQVGLNWMTTIVAAGAQGVTVNPLSFFPKGRRGFAQPSFLCRGREHLRLVYGPEYDMLENRLVLRDKERNQRERNRRTLKQLALSIEGVERFLRNEPKERIDACIRGVLALDVD